MKDFLKVFGGMLLLGCVAITVPPFVIWWWNFLSRWLGV